MRSMVHTRTSTFRSKGWHKRIKTCFQNTRKRSDREDPNVAKRIKAKAKKGKAVDFGNLFPDRPMTEDDSSITSHIAVMKAEYRKKSPDKQVVNTLMDLTLSDRRKLLKEDASLDVIMDTYPFLQKDWQFQAEFARLVPPVNFDENIKKGLRDQTDVILERQHKPSRLEKDLLGASANEVDSSMKQTLRTYAALMALSQMLTEDPEIMFNNKCQEVGPHLLHNGTTLKEATLFTVMVEGQAIVKEKELIKSVTSLLKACYMYDLRYVTGTVKLLTYIQTVYLGLTKSDMTKDIKSLVEKLK